MTRDDVRYNSGSVRLLFAGVGVLIVIIVLAVLYLRFDSTSSACYIADSVTLVDANATGKVVYHLYRIASGSSDKVEFLALFDREVEFDDCGLPNIQPADSVYIEYGSEEGPQQQWINQVVVSNGRVHINYSNIQSDSWSVQWKAQ